MKINFNAAMTAALGFAAGMALWHYTSKYLPE